MSERKVPVQSLIDHIKTAVDVDPWAKEMAEELLKEQEAVEPHQAEAVIWHAGTEHIYLIDTCGACNERIEEDAVFCSRCGRRILWQGR